MQIEKYGKLRSSKMQHTSRFLQLFFVPLQLFFIPDNTKMEIISNDTRNVIDSLYSYEISWKAVR